MRCSKINVVRFIRVAKQTNKLLCSYSCDESASILQGRLRSPSLLIWSVFHLQKHWSRFAEYYFWRFFPKEFILTWAWYGTEEPNLLSVLCFPAANYNSWKDGFLLLLVISESDAGVLLLLVQNVCRSLPKLQFRRWYVLQREGIIRSLPSAEKRGLPWVFTQLLRFLLSSKLLFRIVQRIKSSVVTFGNPFQSSACLGGEGRCLEGRSVVSTYKYLSCDFQDLCFTLESCRFVHSTKCGHWMSFSFFFFTVFVLWFKA